MKNVLVLAIFLSLFGCFAPAKMYRYEPQQSDAIWLNGKEMIKLEQDSIEIILNFDKLTFDVLSFDVAISNQTDEAILIQPENFYLIASIKYGGTAKSVAYNPEYKLQYYDKHIERTVKNKQQSDGIDIIFSLFELAESFQSKGASIKDDEEREEEETNELLREKNYHEKINRLTKEREELENTALRKTTLLPGEKMCGKIFISRPVDTTDIVLYCSIKNTVFETLFKKVRM